MKNSITDGISSKEDELKTMDIVKGCQLRIATMEKEYYDWFMPQWREFVVNMMGRLMGEHLTKTTRYLDLSLKLDQASQSPEQFILTKQSRQSEVISIFSTYMEMGEQFIKFFIPEFCSDNEIYNIIG